MVWTVWRTASCFYNLLIYRASTSTNDVTSYANILKIFGVEKCFVFVKHVMRYGYSMLVLLTSTSQTVLRKVVLTFKPLTHKSTVSLTPTGQRARAPYLHCNCATTVMDQCSSTVVCVVD